MLADVQANRALGVPRRVDHAQADASDLDLIAVGDGAVDVAFVWLAVRLVAEDGDAEVLEQRIDSGPVVAVTVRDHGLAHGEALRRGRQRLAALRGVDEDRVVRLRVRDDVGVVRHWPERAQLHQQQPAVSYHFLFVHGSFLTSSRQSASGTE